MDLGPEHDSCDAFASYLLDEERTAVTFAELETLAFATQQTIRVVAAELSAYGFTIAARPIARSVRGFTTSSNDRWFGPGSEKMHGGACADDVACARFGSSARAERGSVAA